MEEWINLERVYFARDGLTLWAKQELDSFWLDLGPCWGFFEKRQPLRWKGYVEGRPNYVLTKVQKDRPEHHYMCDTVLSSYHDAIEQAREEYYELKKLFNQPNKKGK